MVGKPCKERFPEAWGILTVTSFVTTLFWSSAKVTAIKHVICMFNQSFARAPSHGFAFLFGC